MTAPTTSLAQTRVPAVSAAGEWRRYASFLAKPVLPDSLLPSGAAVFATARMLMLDLMVMVVLIATLLGAEAAGFDLPDNVNETLSPSVQTLALIVVLAPLLEEIAFRSWLRGHPAVIAVVAILVIGLGILPAIGVSMEAGLSQQITLLSGPALAIVAVPLAAYFLLNKPASAFFKRAFPALFWLSTLGFALIHLGNYTGASWETLAILLPLVIPQFALGTMLGYLRVHYGLVYAIALHAAHNAILFGLAVLGGLGAEKAAGA